ncbi:hypothetical protein ACRAWF_18325 [Streptomyces sp. L7]
MIADLLGVPEEFHEPFRVRLGLQKVGSLVPDEAVSGNALEFLRGAVRLLRPGAEARAAGRAS